MKQYEIGESVKIVSGNYEMGCPSLIGKIGKVTSLGTKYTVRGEKTIEVFVEVENSGLHVFNDYHLLPFTSTKSINKIIK